MRRQAALVAVIVAACVYRLPHAGASFIPCAGRSSAGKLAIRPQAAAATSRAACADFLMKKRVNRRKRGAAAGARAHDLDVDGLSRMGHVATVGTRSSPRSPPPLPFPYLCVCDVEATCAEFDKHYVHEIIEFPVVVVDLEAGEVVDEFHSYVRPTVNTTLSTFCHELTGIKQEQVDAAPTLSEVLHAFEAWRLEREWLQYGEERKDFAFAADGPWDLRFFLHGECYRKGIAKPAYFDKWVNIKQVRTPPQPPRSSARVTLHPAPPCVRSRTGLPTRDSRATRSSSPTFTTHATARSTRCCRCRACSSRGGCTRASTTHAILRGSR
jgi:hypothetical protein